MLRHPRPHFGTDGVRGTVGVNLSPEFAYVLGLAVPAVLGIEHDYVVGRDTRKSGKELSNAFISGLISQGATVQDLGVLPTPGVASIARDTNSFCCVITASHNPAEDNGIKVFDKGGLKTSEELESKIEDKISELLEEDFDERYEPVDVNLEFDGMGSALYVSNLHRKSGVESLSGLNVVLDCANGAAYGIAPTVFKMFGAETISINTESDGININNKCGATHLDQLVNTVLESNADIGFAFDGDADRVMVADNKGNVRDGDNILALFALELKEDGELVKDTVVATSMSNGGLKQLLQQNSINFVETQVGDKYVFAAMEETGAVLGGEQSGHVIRKDIAPWGDGILNALLVSEILVSKKRSGQTLDSRNLFDLFTPMAQVQEKVSVSNKSKAVDNSTLKDAINEHIQILGDNSRVIIRPSGTEEVVRITVEAQDKAAAHASAEQLVDIVKEVCE